MLSTDWLLKRAHKRQSVLRSLRSCPLDESRKVPLPTDLQKAYQGHLEKHGYETDSLPYWVEVSKDPPLYRVNDGWGEWYFARSDSGLTWLAQKMPDVLAYAVSKPLDAVFTKAFVRELGWSDEAWDKAILRVLNPSAKEVSESVDDDWEDDLLPLFSVGMGRRAVAQAVLACIPEHEHYIEAMVGAGRVLLAKSPSLRETIIDIQPERIQVWNTLKHITDTEIATLCARNWQGTKGRWQMLYEQQPLSRLDRLYRFLYLAYFSFGGSPERGWRGGKEPVSRDPERLQTKLTAARDRLANVEIICGDAIEEIPGLDSEGALFYCDPPFHESVVQDFDRWGSPVLDYARLFKVLSNLKGKFLLNHPVCPEIANLSESFNRKIINRRSTLRKDGETQEYLIANYLVPDTAQTVLQTTTQVLTVTRQSSLAQVVYLLASSQPRPMYVRSVILEPDIKDDKGRWARAEEVTRAYTYLTRDDKTIATLLRNLGVNHTQEEAFPGITLTALILTSDTDQWAGVEIPGGSMVAELRIDSPEVQQLIRQGQLTGLSMEASAEIGEDGEMHNICIDGLDIVWAPSTGSPMLMVEPVTSPPVGAAA